MPIVKESVSNETHGSSGSGAETEPGSVGVPVVRKMLLVHSYSTVRRRSWVRVAYFNASQALNEP